MAKLIDLTGKTFGHWKVIERAGSDKAGHALWRCECQCPQKNCGVVLGNNLRRGESRSCGCLSNKDFRRYAADLTGQKFGFLKALGATRRGKSGGCGQETFCVCHGCGNEKWIPNIYLLNGFAKSCGCKSSFLSSKKQTSCAGRISQLRIETNFTQKEFASIRGVSRRCLQSWEYGTSPRNSVRRRISHTVRQHKIAAERARREYSTSQLSPAVVAKFDRAKPKREPRRLWVGMEKTLRVSREKRAR